MRHTWQRGMRESSTRIGRPCCVAVLLLCWGSNTMDRQYSWGNTGRCVVVLVSTPFLSMDEGRLRADWLPRWLPTAPLPSPISRPYGLSAVATLSLVMKGSAVRVRSSALPRPPVIPAPTGYSGPPGGSGGSAQVRPFRPVSDTRAGLVRVSGDGSPPNLPYLWAIRPREHFTRDEGVSGSNPLVGSHSPIPMRVTFAP